MKANKYFEELRGKADCYYETLKNLKDRKNEICSKNNWEGPEVDKAFADIEAYEKHCPLTRVTSVALRAWMYSDSDELELNDFLWENEGKEFIDCLKSAGIHSFVYTNQSTAVMDNICQFVNAGAKMIGVVMIEKKSIFDHIDTIPGIRFQID